MIQRKEDVLAGQIFLFVVNVAEDHPSQRVIETAFLMPTPCVGGARFGLRMKQQIKNERFTQSF